MPVKQIVIGGALLNAAILLGVAHSPAVAQSPSFAQITPATSKVASVQSAEGGAIVAELTKPVSARKAKPNDKIECRVTMDLLWHGKIVVARGAKIFGHVTESRTRSKDVSESIVKLDFDRVVLKNGREIPLQATIQAVGAPMQNSASSYNNSDFENQTDMQRPVGPNEMRRIQSTAFPGSRRPAIADEGGVAEADAGALHQHGPALGPLSQGVVGMKGFTLSNTAQGSAISSTRENVRLRGGTQLVLHIVEPQALVDSLTGRN